MLQFKEKAQLLTIPLLFQVKPRVVIKLKQIYKVHTTGKIYSQVGS